MTEIICTGLDGANPLHVLAALGLLRLASRQDPCATLRWRFDGSWRPIVTHVIQNWREHPAVVTELTNELRNIADAGARDQTQERLVGSLKKQRKDILEQSKGTRAKAKEEAKALDPLSRIMFLKEFEGRLGRELTATDCAIAAAQELVNDALGSGVAHLGDVIGVAPAIFRRKADEACHAWLDDKTLGNGIAAVLIADAMSSQGCDVVLDDKGLVQCTPYSFSNGGGGQCLLKAFRLLGSQMTEQQVEATILGKSERFLPGATPLNWDPAEQRDYALAWTSPEDKQARPKQTDVAANVLALIGLSLLTACPHSERLIAVGWHRDAMTAIQSFKWPLWKSPIIESAVRSLFGSIPEKETSRTAMGIGAVMRSERINPAGKRNFFAPSNPC